DLKVGTSGHYRTKLAREATKLILDPNRSRQFDPNQIARLESSIGKRSTPGYWSGQAARVGGQMAPTEPWGFTAHALLGMGTGGGSWAAQAPVAGLGLLAKRFGDTQIERGIADVSRKI